MPFYAKANVLQLGISYQLNIYWTEQWIGWLQFNGQPPKLPSFTQIDNAIVFYISHELGEIRMEKVGIGLGYVKNCRLTQQRILSILRKKCGVVHKILVQLGAKNLVEKLGDPLNWSHS